MQLPEHIKEVGTHSVTLKFSPELTTTVNVVVVPEKQEGEEKTAEAPAKTEAETED